MREDTLQSVARTERLLQMAATLSSLPPEERDRRLAALALTDPELAEEARALGQPLSITRPESEATDGIPERLGPYRLLRQVGRGGMGCVFEALDERWGRRVAVKTIPGMGRTHSPSRERLEREARSHAPLDNHEGIVPLYDAGWDGDCFYLVMRFFDGETLESRLEREGCLILKESLAVARQLSDALSYAHEHGIVHRDIKPANIMIGVQGRVCLLDFGIADLRAESNPAPHADLPDDRRMTAARGSIDYMSPEQFANTEADHRSDIWSLGCVLFECLSGKRAVVRRHDRLGEPCPVEIRWHLIPKRTPKVVHHILRGCLASETRARFGSAADLRQALQEAEQSLARTRRKRLTLTGLGLITVALLGGSGWWLTARGHLERLDVIDGRVLHAVSNTGRVLWERDYPENVQVNRGRNLAPVDQSVWTDGTRPRGAFVSVGGKDGPAALSLLDPGSGRTIWKRPLIWNVPVNAKGPAFYNWTRVVRWSPQDPPVLLAEVSDGVWYGACVQFWSTDGSLLSEYDHPGGLTFLGCEPVRPNVTSSLFLYGVNSSARFRRDLVPFETRNHCGSLVRLDPEATGGQAFPYSEGLPVARDWPGVPRSREAAYVLIPPLCDSGAAAIIDQAWLVDEPAHGRCIRAHLVDGRIFTFDLDLHPLLCYIGLHTEADRALKGKRSRVRLLRIVNGTPETTAIDATY